jgi:hypothetical protein
MAIPFQEFVTGRRSEPVRHEHRRVRHYSRALCAGVFPSIASIDAKACVTPMRSGRRYSRRLRPAG